MGYNRFLTDRHNANVKDLDYSIKQNLRRLSAILLNFARLQALGDDTSYDNFADILNTPDLFIPCSNAEFVKQKELCLRFMKYLLDHHNDVIFKNRAFMNHPYIKSVINTKCINATDLWVAFANESKNSVFDITNYIKLICDVDEKTNKITGFSKSIKDNTYNPKTFNELNEALNSIQGTYNNHAMKKSTKK